MQDFTPVVIGSRAKSATKVLHSSNGIGTGSSVSSAKKGAGAAGISGKLDNSTAHKLDDNEVKPPETVGTKVGHAVASARIQKKWKQEDLANKLAKTKPVVVDLEAGKLKRDNKLLQKAENVLGVWLTGEAERIGTPKTRGKAAASDSGTATPSGSRGSSSSSSGGEETHDKGQNQNKKKADSDKKIKIEGSTGEKREQMSGTAEEGTAAVGNGEGSSEPAQGTTSMIINSSAANA